jgi:hypothetical protein
MPTAWLPCPGKVNATAIDASFWFYAYDNGETGIHFHRHTCNEMHNLARCALALGEKSSICRFFGDIALANKGKNT